MIAWGINALNHGSSLAVFKDGQLISNSSDSQDEIASDTLRQALNLGAPNHIYWYERPWLKKARQLTAGQWSRALDLTVLPRRYLNKIQVHYAPITYTAHHASHAAAGYYTSPFDHCAVVVLDAIGEFECASIWQGKNGKLDKVWSRNYPNSLGLFYSAFTDLIGFTPVQDEWQLQLLAAQGDSDVYYPQVKSYFNGVCQLKYNLHKGVLNWPYQVSDGNRADIAAAVQRVFEEQVCLVMAVAKTTIQCDNLVYMGGCAMNSRANQLFEQDWQHVWSLPNPGDASSSIGAVLYHTGQRQTSHAWGPVKHLAIKKPLVYNTV